MDRKPYSPPVIAPCAASLLLHGSIAALLFCGGTTVVVAGGWSASASAPMQVSMCAPAERVEIEPVPAVIVEERVPEPSVLALEPLPLPPMESAPPSQLLAMAGASAPLPEEPCEQPAHSATELALRFEQVPPPEAAPPVTERGSDAVTKAGSYVAASPLAGSNEPPAYPFVAWRRGVEGTVVVLLDVDADGQVTGARVDVSSGNSSLDEAAVKKLATWTFAPARRDGTAEAAVIRQVVVFRLADRH